MALSAHYFGPTVGAARPQPTSARLCPAQPLVFRLFDFNRVGSAKVIGINGALQAAIDDTIVMTKAVALSGAIVASSRSKGVASVDRGDEVERGPRWHGR
jgi:hypothetical protein